MAPPDGGCMQGIPAGSEGVKNIRVLLCLFSAPGKADMQIKPSNNKNKRKQESRFVSQWGAVRLGPPCSPHSGL